MIQGHLEYRMDKHAWNGSTQSVDGFGRLIDNVNYAFQLQIKLQKKLLFSLLLMVSGY